MGWINYVDKNLSKCSLEVIQQNSDFRDREIDVQKNCIKNTKKLMLK